MNSKLIYPDIIQFCEDKAAKLLQQIAKADHIAQNTIGQSRLLESDVLEENCAVFFRLLLEERPTGDGKKDEIAHSEVRQLLVNAFSLTYRFLLTPTLFISEFLSFETEEVHVNLKMLARLGALHDYPYFREMLEEWFRIHSEPEHIHDRKAELQLFLGNLDNAILQNSTAVEIEHYLIPLYRFFAAEALDRRLIEILFLDKGLSIPEGDSRKQFTCDELSKLLFEVARTSQQDLPESEPVEIPEYNTFLKELRDVGVVLPPPHPPETAKEKELLPPLEMLISSKLREKCIEKIFHSNEKEYERAIAMLNTIENQSQAELNLNSLLEIHRVSQDSKVALRLRKALQSKFGTQSDTNSII